MANPLIGLKQLYDEGKKVSQAIVSIFIIPGSDMAYSGFYHPGKEGLSPITMLLAIDIYLHSIVDGGDRHKRRPS